MQNNMEQIAREIIMYEVELEQLVFIKVSYKYTLVYLIKDVHFGWEAFAHSLNSLASYFPLLLARSSSYFFVLKLEQRTLSPATAPKTL